jgi:hypothetical protein
MPKQDSRSDASGSIQDLFGENEAKATVTRWHRQRVSEMASGQALGSISLPIDGDSIPLDIPPPGMPSRYPTLFTRLPFFIASSKRDLADTDFSGELIDSQYGSVRRYGPGLNVYDEDTLIAVLRLGQQHCVSGVIPGTPIVNRRTGEIIEDSSASLRVVTVHVGDLTAYEINKWLGRSTGGDALLECRASVRRLSLTMLEIIEYNRGAGKEGTPSREGRFQLFQFKGSSEASAMFTVQFTPEMVDLLSSYTRLDMRIRMELTDVGKAVHRFLSSQVTNEHVQYRLRTLRDLTGYRSPLRKFKAALEQQLNLMREFGFILEWSFVGSGGPRTPYTVQIIFRDKRKLTRQ